MTLTDLQSLASTDEGREKIRVMVAEMMGTAHPELGIVYYNKDGTIHSKSFGNSEEYTRQKCANYQRQGIKCGLIERMTSEEEYESSLNACAEFEAGLTDEEHAVFLGCLVLVCDGKRTISASALHRAMAYVLTKQPTKGDE